MPHLAWFLSSVWEVLAAVNKRVRGRGGGRREGGERRRESVGGGFKGVNRDVFDRGRQMLKRSCLFCVKTPPELAGSRAQMALCSKPNANEQIEPNHMQ